jgi:glyoxylase-like metal-dependent hydrolase (beta-lactamase superfamily II)
MSAQVTAITSEIYQVGGYGLTASEDAAIYLIQFNEHAALIDSGCGRSLDKLLNNILSVGIELEQIEYLLITHCHYDHTGGAKNLRERLGCPVVAHALDAPFIEQGDAVVTAAIWYGAILQPCVVDRKLSGSEEAIALGGRTITAVHIPGHSPGSVAYWTLSEGCKVVFAQDVHGPLDPDFLSNRTDYLESLERLLDLEADILCEGHYGIFQGKQAVAGFIRSFMVYP